MAARHNVTIVFESIDGSEAFVMGRSIFLDPTLYPPRMNWLFCHELAHILLGHIESGLHSREQEYEADRLASELILPEAEFKPLAAEMNLEELKAFFPRASWEAIARRRIRFRPAVLTVIDNEKLTSRSAPEWFNYPHFLTPPEKEIISQCYSLEQHQFEDLDGFSLEAYFIDEGRGVKRVILITEIND